MGFPSIQHTLRTYKKRKKQKFYCMKQMLSLASPSLSLSLLSSTTTTKTTMTTTIAAATTTMTMTTQIKFVYLAVTKNHFNANFSILETFIIVILECYCIHLFLSDLFQWLPCVQLFILNKSSFAISGPLNLQGKKGYKYENFPTMYNYTTTWQSTCFS